MHRMIEKLSYYIGDGYVYGINFSKGRFMLPKTEHPINHH